MRPSRMPGVTATLGMHERACHAPERVAAATGQLDLFHQPDEPALDDVPPAVEPAPRRTQLTELPGTTFEDIFEDAA